MPTGALAPPAIPPRVVEGPVRRRPWRPLMLIGLVAAGAAGAWTLRARAPWASAAQPLEAAEIDRGDVAVVLVEGGSLESANSTTIKCKVEALIGLVGGATGNAAQPGGTAAAGGGGGTVATTASTAAAAPKASSTSASAAATKSATGTTAAAGTTGTATATGAALTTTAGSAAAGASAGGGATAGGGGGGGGGSGSIKPPDVRSFTYTIAAHVPLRPAAATQTKTVAAAPAAGAPGGGGGGGGGRGGGGGGGGRGGGGVQAQQEKPGSTRIISILPEGTQVRAGDVVCVLDSATFRDEVDAQLIRHAQARSYVEQAKAALEVNNIALKEYRDGVLPMDRESVDDFISACTLDYEKVELQSQWSADMAKKGLRTKSQIRSDQLEFQRAEIALREARSMKRRLDDHTAPKILKSLEAKGYAIKADLLAQEAAFGLESDRLRRLQTAVANCTLRAPAAGVVAYANTANRWGQVDNPIQEGITVREGMSIFDLPDPKHLRVRARVNESKFNALRTGQVAEVSLDAYPGRPLRGVVAEITPIPAANGAMSDVKNYTAILNITSESFEGLRPGLSAQVVIDAGAAIDVVRIPAGAVRWVGGRPFAALLTPGGHVWRPLELGLMNAAHAEVRSGLAAGDRVVASPGTLAPPSPAAPAHAPVQTAARP